MVGAAALLAAALLVPGHSRSEGRSRFTLDEEGQVAIEITLGDVDLAELCDADLAGGNRALAEKKLLRCLERDIPVLVRLRGDEMPCPAVFDSFEEQGRVVLLRAHARCAALPRSLVVDWGLFASSPLDHVSVATLTPPFGEPSLALLSKRAPRARLELGLSPIQKIGIGLAGVAVLALGAGFVVVRRRRARTEHNRGPS